MPDPSTDSDSARKMMLKSGLDSYFWTTQMSFNEQLWRGHHDGGTKVHTGPAGPDSVCNRNSIENIPPTVLTTTPMVKNHRFNWLFRDAGIPGRIPNVFLVTLARIPTSEFLANFASARKRDPSGKARAFKLANNELETGYKYNIWDPEGVTAEARSHPNWLWLWLLPLSGGSA
jgi:hypothetical protein